MQLHWSLSFFTVLRSLHAWLFKRLESATLSHEPDTVALVTTSASVMLNDSQAALLAMQFLEASLDLQPTRNCGSRDVEGIHLRVSTEYTPGVFVELHTRQLCVFVEPSLDLDHREAAEDGLEVVLCDILKFDQLVGLETFPADNVMHLGKDAIGQAAGDALACGELLQQVLPDRLLSSGGSLLACVHKVTCHGGYLFPKLVVGVEDVGVEHAMIVFSQHSLQVCCVLGQSHTAGTKVECDGIYVQSPFGQCQAGLAELKGHRDCPKGVRVDLLQAVHGRLQHRVNRIQKVALDAHVKIGRCSASTLHLPPCRITLVLLVHHRLIVDVIVDDAVLVHAATPSILWSHAPLGKEWDDFAVL